LWVCGLPLANELGWDRKAITWVLSRGTILGGLAGPYFGRVVDRFGAGVKLTVTGLGLAWTLLPYLPDEPVGYLIEEPEDGLHPKAIEGVFQSLSSVYGGQVLVATHSPLFMGLAKPAQLLCFARNPSGAVDIVRGDQHPALHAAGQRHDL